MAPCDTRYSKIEIPDEPELKIILNQKHQTCTNSTNLTQKAVDSKNKKFQSTKISVIMMDILMLRI